MSYPTTIAAASGEIAFARGTVLTGFGERTRGLIGRRSVRPDEAWIFPRCRSVHTCFMSMPIDVVFIDGSGTVLDVRTIGPRHPFLTVPKARTVLETGAGNAAARNVKAGTKLIWKEASYVQTLSA